VRVVAALRLQAKLDVLLGVEGNCVRLDGAEEGGLVQPSFHSAIDRRGRVTMVSM